MRNHEFAGLDVEDYVTDNEVVRRGITTDGLRWAFTTRHAANWHPLTWLSHMLDVELFGLDPGRHLLVNAALHLAAAILLLFVLLALTGTLWPSAFVAGMFALHPLHVESVAWIAERKDVLSAVFWMLTVGAYVGHVRGRGRQWLPAAALLHAAGLMTKPVAVTLPFALLLLDFWPLGRTFSTPSPAAGAGRPWCMPRALLTEKLPLFLLSLASLLATLWSQVEAAMFRIPLGARVGNALVSCATYLGKTIWPASLAAFYPHPSSTAGGLSSGKVVLAFIVIVTITGVVLLLARRAPFLAVGWLWYLGTLTPMLGLVQVGAQALADRYTYLPLVGIATAVAWSVAAVVGVRGLRPLPLGVLGLVALTALAAMARAQVLTWRSTETVFEHALAVTEGNWMAHDVVGRSLQMRGQTARAVPHFEEALRLSPGFVPARNRLALALLDLGRREEALRQFRETVRLDPSYAPARYNLGMLAAQLGHWGEAREQHRALKALGLPQADQVLGRIPPRERGGVSPSPLTGN